jgi:hypothetical protein
MQTTSQPLHPITETSLGALLNSTANRGTVHCMAIVVLLVLWISMSLPVPAASYAPPAGSGAAGVANLKSTCQSCDSSQVITGNGEFSIQLLRAMLLDDGRVEFAYEICNTGSAPKSPALGYWILNLDPLLSGLPEDLTVTDLVEGWEVSPALTGLEDCVFVLLDPNTQLSGLRFEHLELERGQCQQFKIFFQHAPLLERGLQIGLDCAVAATKAGRQDIRPARKNQPPTPGYACVQAPITIIVSVDDNYHATQSLSIPAPGVLANDANGQIENLTAVLVSGPAHGALALNSDGSFEYTPNRGFHGQDGFVYRAVRGALESTDTTVVIDVARMNTAPQAEAQLAHTSEDAPLTLTLQAKDAEGDTLTFRIVSTPGHGTLSGTPPNLSYHPAADFNGADSFTFQVNDGELDSSVATVSIQVDPVNDAPSAESASIDTREDSAVAITLQARDVENSALNYTIVSAPVHGHLSGTPPNLNYQPAADFNGTDSFTFQVNDGELDSNVATVSIQVNPVNDAPSAESASISTEEDSAVAITLQARDVENSALNFTIVSAPAYGHLSGTPPKLNYQPAADFNGADSFTFQVNDGELDSNVATVSIQVDPVNDAPIVGSPSLTTMEDTPLIFQLAGSDPDGDPLLAKITIPASRGKLYQVTVIESDGVWTTNRGPAILDAGPHLVTHPDRLVWYEPDPDLVGLDGFAYYLEDPSGATSPERNELIAIQAVNDPPMANTKELFVKNTFIPVRFGLNVSDIDSSGLTVTVTRFPSKGKLFRDNNGPSTEITPENPSFKGYFWFYTASFGDWGSETITEIPTTVYTYAPNGDVTATPVLNAVDWYYCDFEYQVSDGLASSPVVKEIISVQLVNHPPQPLPPSPNPMVCQEDSKLDLKLDAQDADATQTLSIIFTSIPRHGKLFSSSGIEVKSLSIFPESGNKTGWKFSYVPDSNFHGTDSFTYDLFDSKSFHYPEQLTVTITVTPVNDAPAITASSTVFASRSVEDGAVIPAILSDAQFADVDADGDVMRLTIQSQDLDRIFLLGGAELTSYRSLNNATRIEIEGTLASLNNLFSGDSGRLIAFPGAQNIGTVTLTLEEVGSSGGTEPLSATKLITVRTEETERTVADELKSECHSLSSNGAISFRVTSREQPNGVTNATITRGPLHGSITGTLPNLTYTPAAGFVGPDSIEIAIPGSELGWVGFSVENP